MVTSIPDFSPCLTEVSVSDTSSHDWYLAIKVVMMPRDTNPFGTIFGGVLLSYMDQAGAVGARHVIQNAGWSDKTIVSVGHGECCFSTTGLCR